MVSFSSIFSHVKRNMSCVQMSVLHSESAAGNALQYTAKSLESEKAQLQEQVRSLEKSLTAAQKSSPAAPVSGPADIPTGKYVSCFFAFYKVFYI